MMRIALAFALSLLAAAPALAQPRQDIGAAFAGAPAVTTLGSDEILFAYQGGLDKKLTPSVLFGTIPTSVIITTPAGTTMPGITVTQVGPSGTGAVGNFSYSTINVTSPTNYGSGGQVGSAWQVNGTVNGANSQGNWWNLRSEATATGTFTLNGDVIAGVPRCVYVGATNNGVGGCYGINAQAILTDDGLGNHSHLTGMNGEMAGVECDARIDTGSTSPWRFGCSAVSTGPVKGTSQDAAFKAGAGSTPWGNLLMLSDSHGSQPVDPTGALITANSTTSYTIHDVINLPHYTCSGGNILALTNVTWTCAGVLTTSGFVATGSSFPISGSSTFIGNDASFGYIDAAHWGVGALPLILQAASGGGVTVGSAVDPGAGNFRVTGTVRSNTGFNINGTAGASCTLTTVAHLTVVNGIVTLCN